MTPTNIVVHMNMYLCNPSCSSICTVAAFLQSKSPSKTTETTSSLLEREREELQLQVYGTRPHLSLSQSLPSSCRRCSACAVHAAPPMDMDALVGGRRDFIIGKYDSSTHRPTDRHPPTTSSPSVLEGRGRRHSVRLSLISSLGIVVVVSQPPSPPPATRPDSKCVIFSVSLRE